jgi:hypothetical protein
MFTNIKRRLLLIQLWWHYRDQDPDDCCCGGYVSRCNPCECGCSPRSAVEYSRTRALEQFDKEHAK